MQATDAARSLLKMLIITLLLFLYNLLILMHLPLSDCQVFGIGRNFFPHICTANSTTRPSSKTQILSIMALEVVTITGPEICWTAFYMKQVDFLTTAALESSKPCPMHHITLTQYTFNILENKEEFLITLLLFYIYKVGILQT